MADHYTIRGGLDSTAVFKAEDVYNEGPANWTTGAQHFGIVQTVTPSLSRNLIKSRGLMGDLPDDNLTPTARDAHNIRAGKSELTVDVEYQPQHFEFLEYVLGSKSTAGNVTQYPQEDASTNADKRKYLTVPSFAIAQRFDFGGTNDAASHVLEFLGLKVNTWNIQASIGDPISCSANMMGGHVKIKDTDIDTNYPLEALDSKDVWHFINSEIKIGADAISNLIDGFQLTVTNNAQGLGDIRSYVNEAVVVMGRDFALTIDMNLENITYIKSLLGDDTITHPGKIDTLTIELERDDHTVHLILTDLKYGDGLPGTSYGEVSKNNLALEAKLLRVEEDITPPGP